MTFMNLRLLTWAGFGAVFAEAIVTKGDPNDPKFLSDIAVDAPFFVSLFNRGDCAGTIVGNHHVLTAAHCVGNVRQAPETILFDGSTIKPWAAFMNPDCIFSVEDDGPDACDVAMLAFEEDIVERLSFSGGGAPIALPVYPSSDEVGKTITLYGYGLSGDAADLTGNNGCNKAQEDGKFRRAQNIVTDVSDGVIRYRMDKGNGLRGLDLEGMAQDGDSGGAATVRVGGTTYLVGANSGTMERNSCDYGSIDMYVRLSEHFDFIGTILNYPNDQSISPWKKWKQPDLPSSPTNSPPNSSPSTEAPTAATTSTDSTADSTSDSIADSTSSSSDSTSDSPSTEAPTAATTSTDSTADSTSDSITDSTSSSSDSTSDSPSTEVPTAATTSTDSTADSTSDSIADSSSDSTSNSPSTEAPTAATTSTDSTADSTSDSIADSTSDSTSDSDSTSSDSTSDSTSETSP